MQVLYMLGDITSGPGYKFTQWLELVRKRSSQYGNPGLSHYPRRTNSMPFLRFVIFFNCVNLNAVLLSFL